MNPLIYVGIILAVFTVIFLIAFLLIKDKKEAFGFDRNMKDSEITKRLLAYAKNHHWYGIKSLGVIILISSSNKIPVLSYTSFLIKLIKLFISEKLALFSLIKKLACLGLTFASL